MCCDLMGAVTSCLMADYLHCASLEFSLEQFLEPFPFLLYFFFIQSNAKGFKYLPFSISFLSRTRNNTWTIMDPPPKKNNKSSQIFLQIFSIVSFN